jgi:hypothetical protein
MFDTIVHQNHQTSCINGSHAAHVSLGVFFHLQAAKLPAVKVRTKSSRHRKLGSPTIAVSLRDQHDWQTQIDQFPFARDIAHNQQSGLRVRLQRQVRQRPAGSYCSFDMF